MLGPLHRFHWATVHAGFARWWLLAAIGLVALVASYASLRLHDFMDVRRQGQLALADLAAHAHALDAIESEVIATRDLKARERDERQQARDALDAALGQLGDLNLETERLAQLRQAALVFRTRSDQAFAFADTGDFARAAVVDREQVDVALDALVAAVTDTQADAAASADAAETVSEVGTVLLLMLTALAIGGLFLRIDASRRAAARAQAEQDALRRSEHEAQRLNDELERRVTERTAQAGVAIREMRGQMQERKQAQEALEQLARRHALILESAAEGIIGVDRAGTAIFVNPAAARLLGYDVPELLGRSMHTLIHHSRPDGTSYPPEQCPTRGALKDGQARHVSQEVFWRKDGSALPIEYHSTPVRDGGEITGGVVVFNDIAERMRAEAALQQLALNDPLTGLPNRTLLQDRLRQALLSAQRDRTPCALLVLDLDRFKEVNDSFGHASGDVLLKEVGERLHSAVRGADTVARLGGDEFAVVLPGTDRAGSELAAAKLIAALEQPFVVEAHPIVVEASVGIALYPEQATTPEALLRLADVAMYDAKSAGRGPTVYTLRRDPHRPDLLILISALRDAIESGTLELYYQPKVSFASREVVGVEALARWTHPTRGTISPAQFIPLAEGTGLIHPFSRWVLRTALAQVRAWQEQGLALPIAINLSMRNLHDPALPDAVAQALAAAGVGAEWLHIEITESAMMADPTQAERALRQLAALGVQLSLDDFGTGYTSLGYLGRLPFHEFKIDQSFIKKMLVDERDAAIVRAAIDLGHELGLSVVAEGVEDAATWDTLAARGCDVAQGYYLSRPLPAAELPRWVAARVAGTP